MLEHKISIYLNFVDNLPPGYDFIKNNLQGSKKPLILIVLEYALRSRHNVHSGGKKGRAIPDTGLFVSGLKADIGVARGGDRAGTNKGKQDSRS